MCRYSGVHHRYYLSTSSLNRSFLLCLSNILVKSANLSSCGLPLIVVVSLNTTSTNGFFLESLFSSSICILQDALREGGICESTALAQRASFPNGLKRTVTFVKYLVIIVCLCLRVRRGDTLLVSPFLSNHLF
jgi:hypothetical protein